MLVVAQQNDQIKIGLEFHWKDNRKKGGPAWGRHFDAYKNISTWSGEQQPDQ